MPNQHARRRTAPKRTLIGPLVMLASGVAVGVLVWRVLMLEPGPTEGMRLPATERLSHQDQRALDRLLSTHGTRP